MEIKVWQRFCQCNLVTHPHQLDATQQLVSRQDALLNPVPNVASAVTIDMKNAAEGAFVGWRQHHHSVYCVFHNTISGKVVLILLEERGVHLFCGRSLMFACRKSGCEILRRWWLAALPVAYC